MAETKNTLFDRPGGYAAPSGATHVQRMAAGETQAADIRLLGDVVEPHQVAPPPTEGLEPLHEAMDPETKLYLGDCRDVPAATGHPGKSRSRLRRPAIQLGCAL